MADITLPIELVQPGDVLPAFFGGPAVIVSLVNDRFMPGRVNVTIGDPDDATMPTRMVQVNRNQLVRITRTP